jgi:hypothetical protein
MLHNDIQRARDWARVIGWTVFGLVLGILGWNLFAALEQALGPIRGAL